MAALLDEIHNRFDQIKGAFTGRFDDAVIGDVHNFMEAMKNDITQLVKDAVGNGTVDESELGDAGTQDQLQVPEQNSQVFDADGNPVRSGTASAGTRDLDNPTVATDANVGGDANTGAQASRNSDLSGDGAMLVDPTADPEDPSVTAAR